MVKADAGRRTRANGQVSREKILDAAAEIAGERGYEGTSINRISERSGLPASSIYWHFTDKDELIAAVIDRSFNQWADAIRTPLAVLDDASAERVFRLAMQRTGAAIAEFPDYLRLGLMLILEHRPEEPTARRRYLETRRVASDGARALYRDFFDDLGRNDIDALVTLTMALADGLFVAQEVGEVELDQAFDLLATAILGAADRLRAAKAPRKRVK
jgi:AcrR family transcriptional regulator